MAKATQPAKRVPRQPLGALGQSPSLPPATPVVMLASPTLPPLGVPSVPRWKRSHDSRMRKKVARILVLKLAGRKTSEIAKRLDTTPDTIRHYLYIAGKNGWLTADGMELADPAEQLVYEASHKIVRNINQALDGTAPLKPQQYDMTVEAAKGIGMFKSHSASKVEGQVSMPSLEIKFEMPRNAPIEFVPPTPDSYGGKPAYVDGQVIDTKALPEGSE